MKRFVGTVVLIACVLFIGASGASAALINTRPVPVFVNPSEPSLAELMVIAGFNAATPQNTAAYFKPSGGALPPLSNNSEMQLIFEYASSAPGNILGIYALGDITKKIELFPGSAEAVGSPAAVDHTYSSLVTFNASGTVNVTTIEDGVGNLFQLFNVPFGTNQFGFYFTSTALGVTWYSEDDLNSGDAHMLAFVDADNDWLFAWENQPFLINGFVNPAADKDYNDMVFTAQSIKPVPEPGTMMLLGSGLVGLAGWGRKKFRK